MATIPQYLAWAERRIAKVVTQEGLHLGVMKVVQGPLTLTFCVRLLQPTPATLRRGKTESLKSTVYGLARANPWHRLEYVVLSQKGADWASWSACRWRCAPTAPGPGASAAGTTGRSRSPRPLAPPCLPRARPGWRRRRRCRRGRLRANGARSAPPPTTSSTRATLTGRGWGTVTLWTAIGAARLEGIRFPRQYSFCGCG
jgi:hypothetical protein